MDANAIFPIELAFFFGILVVLGGWDLWRLDRQRARDQQQEQVSRRDEASGTATGTGPNAH